MKYPPIIRQIPHIVHGGDYNPDQWLREKDVIWKEDMRLAKLAGLNSLSVGIFSWAALEPEEGVYDFAWLDEIMDLMAENGLTAVLATPSGARPAWLSQKYPEVLRVNERREKLLHGGRHNHCLSSQVYRRKVQEINTLLAERYKDHPALGAWHISNEFGGECHCPACQENFRLWLREKYDTLDNLNHAWWTAFWSHTYTDWSQVESPSPLGEQSVHAQKLDWKRFTTDQFIKWYRIEVEPLKRITPNVPCTTNLMGIYPGINYFDLAKELDFACWDSYPQWESTENDVEIAQFFSFEHDLTRGLKGGKPFFLMESCPSATNWRPYARLHRPGVHKLQSMQAIAHGADSVQYFQFRKSRGSSEKFHGAVVDHCGHEHTRVFSEIADLGKLLAQMDEIVGTTAPARVALVYDWENRWALEDAQGLCNVNKKYVETVMDHYSALWRKGVSVDIVDQAADFSGHDVLIAPFSYMLRGDFALRVDEFVQAGGTFVTTYGTGYVDENDLCILGGFPGPLKKTLGIWAEEIDVLMPGMENHATLDGTRYALTDYAELIHPEGAQVLSTYEEDFYAGMPALTVNTRGKGKAYYIAARFSPAFLDAFYGKLLSEEEIPQHDLPAGVTIATRTDGETNYAFVLNFAPEARQVKLTGADFFTGEEVSDFALPAHGFRILKTQA
ncbi:MAG: beta-galactosidase [Candidatus Spyradocola sp.]|jgi:beta-galactosidase